MKLKNGKEGSDHVGPCRTLAFVQRDGKLLGGLRKVS